MLSSKKYIKLRSNLLKGGSFKRKKTIENRYVFFNIIVILTFSFLTLFSTYYLTQDKPVLSLSLFSFGLVFFLLFLLARKEEAKYFKFSYLTTLLLYVIFFTFNSYTDLDGYANQIRFTWFIFPIVYAYFLGGRKHGCIMSTSSLVISVLIYSFSDLIMTNESFINSIAFIIITTVFTHMIEKNSEDQIKRVLDIDKTVEQLVNERTSENMYRLMNLEEKLEKQYRNN